MIITTVLNQIINATKETKQKKWREPIRTSKPMRFNNKVVQKIDKAKKCPINS